MCAALQARIAVLSLCAVTGACARDDAAVLHVYTSLDAQEAPVYLDAFTRETGIATRWVRLSAGEALARLEAERGNPQVAVWFGGPSPEYIVAAQRGLLEAVEAPAEPGLGPDQRAAGGEWTGFYTGVIGFVCNDAMLRQRNAECPRRWSDLLQPSLRGQVSMAYPYTSGTAYIVVVALLALFGEEQGWEYVRRLNAQVHRYNSSGTAAVTQVGMGEVAVGIAFAHDILKKGVERGYPVTLRIPEDGTAAEVGAVALVRGGPRPELGRRFIEWLLTVDAQNLLADFYRTPLHPAARRAERGVETDGIPLISYDAAAAAAGQSRILARWREITGR